MGKSLYHPLHPTDVSSRTLFHLREKENFMSYLTRGRCENIIFLEIKFLPAKLSKSLNGMECSY